MTYEALPELVPAPLRGDKSPTRTQSPHRILSVPREHHGSSYTWVFARVLLFAWINALFPLYPGNPYLSFNSQLRHKLLRKLLWPHWSILGAHSTSSHGPLSFLTITRFAILKLNFLLPKTLSSLNARISLVPLYYIAPGI